MILDVLFGEFWRGWTRGGKVLMSLRWDISCGSVGAAGRVLQTFPAVFSLQQSQTDSYQTPCF